ncbi:efflux RND transporter periplasmic adaptor subunit [Planctomyces sp. SH-PL14]|uniref:efflux RND transporter periplasmic adaptor subunit n=1 Tax=Planctomyces sp. SH-PL14 TaxID=1632864 RepID=UPI0009ED422C|nr:efflux RND transporter periplasmic adaptor subunit [Planctomyces sp. SH-PL14]
MNPAAPAPPSTPTPAAASTPAHPPSPPATRTPAGAMNGHGSSAGAAAPPPASTPATTPAAAPSRRGWLGWVVLLALAGGAWYARPYWYPRVHALLVPAGPKAPPPPRAVPIVATTVRERDINLYINGLGTVTAFNTVTVRSRVAGEVVKVAFTEGQTVKEGDLLVEIDPRPFIAARDQAAGTLAREDANLSLAQVNLKRTEDLMKSQASTQAVYDQQLAAVQQSEAAVKVAKAALENAELQLTYCRIVAPITGRIGFRLIDKGNIVQANDPGGLVVITQLDPITLQFTIPQDDIPRVLEQMNIEGSLQVDAYDRDFKRKLATGKLSALDNQVDATTGTLRLKATFENKNRALFPNQFVNARLLVDAVEKAVVVNTSAVQRGPESTFVYVVKSDETVELRNIELGPSEGLDTSIKNGLKVGELVVVDGVDKLTPGAKVQFQDKASPAGKKPASKPGNEIAAEKRT